MTDALFVPPPKPGGTEGTIGSLLVVVLDEATRHTARVLASEMDWTAVEIREGGIKTAVELLESGETPENLIVDIDNSSNPVAEMAALRRLCGLDCRIIVLGIVNDVRLYRRLIDVGVTDYLLKPLSRETLSNALRVSHRTRTSSAERKPACQIALIGARGGAGVTTLAISLASLLSKRRKVVLLDLDLYFGSVSLSLDLTSPRGLCEILTNPDRVDKLLIASAMTKLSERLRILDTEEPLGDLLKPGSSGLVALLADIRYDADVIVIDTPRSLDALSRHSVESADAVGIVTDLSLAGMRDTQRLLRLVEEFRGGYKAVVIANRVGGVPAEIGRSDFERGIGAPLSVRIPNDRKAAAAASQLGRPFSEVTRLPRTLTELDTMALALGGDGERRAPATSSFLNRMLGR